VAITQTIVDDFDGSQPASTYRFALDGADYEIDLSEDNLTKLRGALAPFIAAGRRRPKTTTRPGRGRRAAATRPGPAGPASAAVRAWWVENWHAVGLPEPTSHLGQIPTQVRDAYRDAHPATAPVADPPAHH